jgi:DnaD/phage-associated family protein
MPNFKGFPEGKVHLTPVPSPFFTDLLPHMNQLGEVKLTLYIFWRLDRMEGTFRYLRRTDLLADAKFMESMGATTEAAQAAIDSALEQAVKRGTLLQASLDFENSPQEIYFLNSPKGRAALRAIQSGNWRLTGESQEPAPAVNEPPNIFRLYEENIGPLTPMIADELTEAEQSYSSAWIEEAIRIAVENNKRNLRYIFAILERWRREGKHGQKEKPEDRPDSSEAGREYVEGKYSEFIEH